jgi:hypothetical protein
MEFPSEPSRQLQQRAPLWLWLGVGVLALCVTTVVVSHAYSLRVRWSSGSLELAPSPGQPSLAAGK